MLFLGELQKRGFKKMLEGDFDAQLRYDKLEKRL